jgi:ribosome-associated protein
VPIGPKGNPPWPGYAGNPLTSGKDDLQKVEINRSYTIFVVTRCVVTGRVRQTKGFVPLSTPALSRVTSQKPELVSRRPDAEETLSTVLAALEDMKAEDIVTIDLSGKTSIGDFMVVATGRSQRHVASIADNVVKDVEQSGIARVRVEGMRQADWVLIDAGDVIVHVFRPEIRSFYNIEKMWAGGHGKTRHPR